MTREPASADGRSRWLALLLCRVVLAAVFVWSGAAKLLAPPQTFADGVASFRLVPAGFISPLALALPPLEILVGTALFVGRPRRLGAFGALSLSGVFLAALTAALARSLPVDCGCFGPGAAWLPLTAVQRVWFDLGRDLLLVAASLALYRQQLAASASPANP